MYLTEFELQIDNYMLYCTSKDLSKKTLATYEQSLKLFAMYLNDEFGITEPSKTSTVHIRQYMKYLQERGKYTVYTPEDKRDINVSENRSDYSNKISNTTINNYLRNIKVFFNFLYAEREINKNPVSQVTYLKSKRKPKETITKEDFKKVLHSFNCTRFAGFRDWMITRTILDTGMRIGETLSLKVEDIDIKNKVVNVHRNVKGGKPRYVYFSFKTASDLRRWIQYKDRHVESDLLFPSNRGGLLQIYVYERHLRDAGKRVGVKIHPHQLRNNFAKNYLLNGGEIFSLSKILGHSSTKITEQAYLDLTNEELRKQYQKRSPIMNWDI